MSSHNEGERDTVFGSRESCGSGGIATAEATDIKDCIEKLNTFGTVRLPIFEEEEAREWLKRIQAVSKVTWRVMRTEPGGRKNVFKLECRCQHNVQGTQELRGKNTNCPAKFRLVLKRTQLAKGAKSRSKDALITSHPLVASLQGEHNHAIDVAASLKYRDVSEEVQRYLTDLFASGHSPSSAYHLMHCHLMATDPDGYVVNAADRHYLPDLKYCYNLYYKVCRKEYSVPDGDALLAAESPSCSPSHHVARMSEETHVHHASDDGQQAAEAAAPSAFADIEQISEEGAAEASENTDEKTRTLGLWRAFIEEQAETPKGLKHLTAMIKTVERLGNGPALHRAMRSFGRVTARSLRASKSTTTVGRRKKVLGGGRKRVFDGQRVSTVHFAGQHLQAAKKRRTPAPHFLSHCVASNVSVG